MTTPVTNHVAETAVPGQNEVTIRASHGELELGQEYDGEWHGVYVQPQNVLTLIRSMLRMIGMDDVYLYEQKPGGLCNDVDWPQGPFSPREVAMMNSRPDIDWAAVMRDLPADLLEDEAEDERPKDPTAAARMRRYRDRKRNAAERNTVTTELPLRPATTDQEVLQAAE